MSTKNTKSTNFDSCFVNFACTGGQGRGVIHRILLFIREL